uniref:Fibrinogen C-terminal domain-containing protein n=1 Tax=Cynoglossus semilaevis TaxID=244447 RepID=A0A3P8UE68_CYNSE
MGLREGSSQGTELFTLSLSLFIYIHTVYVCVYVCACLLVFFTGTDCSQILAQSPKASSGVYVIKPPGAKTPFQVYCEMREDGGWIVFQRRSGEALSFNKKWEEYKHGFGKLKHDHWLGLNKVFLLSQVETWALRVDLWDHDGGSAYAQYENFRIENEKTAFKLHIGEFSGNAGDAFRGSYPGGDQNGFGFSTADRDNDGCSPCIFDDMAQLDCTFSAGGSYSLKASRMMIKPSTAAEY